MSDAFIPPVSMNPAALMIACVFVVLAIVLLYAEVARLRARVEALQSTSKLRRFADLSEEIAWRLMGLRNWNEYHRTQHGKDCAERDELLAEVSDTYLPRVTAARSADR